MDVATGFPFVSTCVKTAFDGGADGKARLCVPKDTPIIYSIYGMHRRRDIYGADAEEFKPERWELIKPGWGDLAFPAGPRNCVGREIASTEAFYTLVRILQTFNTIESRDERPWAENIKLAVRGLHGTKAMLQAVRKSLT
ncbi:cytochrome P450 [Glonium stellatum]|uniref:Cytochrome P450 n=1 Tax=Glonium stellatum TaxID=574774 RepID=A0A8E2JU99_9PEZI|nr:cytochrome P450 [Glonium stellatum]